MKIYCARIYDPPQHHGYRVLADRIWPRGMTKERAALDEWCKTLTPGTTLRQWFKHDPAKWQEFSHLYKEELHGNKDEARALLKRAGKQPIILLSATKDTDHTHTLILKKFLESL